MYISELADIFETEDLKEAFTKEKHEESLFQPSEVVTHKGDLSNTIYFVSRGIIIEKNGDLDDFNTP